MAPPKNVSQKLGDEQEAETIHSLGETVGAFATRIQRKLKEQEEREGVSAKQAEARHARMIQAMTTIRKALQETAKISLGPRFSFRVEVGDWEGWPRVQLFLRDSLAPDMITHSLNVTPNDRQELGAIDLQLKSGEVVERLHMCEPEELKKLPFILKKALRHFLDLVGAYVLNPVKPDELLAQQTKHIQSEELDEVADQLKGEDVFTEEMKHKENVIEAEKEEVEPVELELFSAD